MRTRTSVDTGPRALTLIFCMCGTLACGDTASLGGLPGGTGSTGNTGSTGGATGAGPGDNPPADLPVHEPTVSTEPLPDAGVEGVAVATDGTVWVAAGTNLMGPCEGDGGCSYADLLLAQFDTQGILVRSETTPDAGAFDMVASADSGVFVLQRTSGQVEIVRYDKDADPIWRLGVPDAVLPYLGFESAIVATANGGVALLEVVVYATGEQRIRRLEPDGGTAWSSSAPAQGRVLGMDGSGSIIVSGATPDPLDGEPGTASGFSRVTVQAFDDFGDLSWATDRLVDGDDVTVTAVVPEGDGVRIIGRRFSPDAEDLGFSWSLSPAGEGGSLDPLLLPDVFDGSGTPLPAVTIGAAWESSWGWIAAVPGGELDWLGEAPDGCSSGTIPHLAGAEDHVWAAGTCENGVVVAGYEVP